MEETVHKSIRVIEDSMEEINIVLRMNDTNLYSYISYIQGKINKPPYLSEWAEESLMGEFENLVESIEELNQIKLKLAEYIKLGPKSKRRAA